MPVDNAALLAFTRDLIRLKSLSGQEGLVVERMAAEMRRLAFDRVELDGTGSLIGIVEGTRPGPTLLLDGHCDTVDAHAPDWTRDPWGGQVADGRLYGRGAADMKGSLAAMIHSIGTIDRGGLGGKVAVSATVSEEVFEGGSLRGVVESIRPDFVVIGESTRLELNRGGRGRAELVVTTQGRSAHSSSPQAGRCAVTDMLRVIQAIAARPVPADAVLGPGSIVLTDIMSQPYPGRSVIPYRCRVSYDRRLLPGESASGLLADLRTLPGLADVEYDVALAAQEELCYGGILLEGEKFFPAWVLPEEHPFVQNARRGLESAGLRPRIGAYRFCTNAAYCAGIAGIPTVGFGIGREEDAHIVDESIAVADLATAARGYQGIIRSVCRP